MKQRGTGTQGQNRTDSGKLKRQRQRGGRGPNQTGSDYQQDTREEQKGREGKG